MSESSMFEVEPRDDVHALDVKFLAHRLVVARRRLEMSQKELARLLHVDQSTVSRLERGDMQGPPWSLVMQACLHLGIEPHALMVDEPEIFPRKTGLANLKYKTCRPISMARARVAQHFLYLGSQEGRLAETLRHCLSDLMRVRPTVIGLSVILFEGFDRRATHFHAQWRQGEVSWAEHQESEVLRAATNWLKERWEHDRTAVRETRPEVPAWDPHLVVDEPIDLGMVGFDFAEDEDPDRDATLWWTHQVAEVFNLGIRLVPPRAQLGIRDELAEIARRLAAIEDGLVPRAAGG